MFHNWRIASSFSDKIFEVNKAYVVLQVHMFDIDVPGGIKFTESDVLSPGNSLQMFEIGMMLIN